MATEQIIKIEKNSLKKLTVFTDRAELRREFSVNLAEGENEIIFENVANSVAEESIRVTGLGDAVIQGVQIKQRRLSHGEGDSKKNMGLKDKKDELTLKIQRVEREKASIGTQCKTLDSMFEKMASNMACPSKDDGVVKADDAALESITKFFAYFNEQALKLGDTLQSREDELTKLRDELKTVQHELLQLTSSRLVKVISVSLESAEGGVALLQLTYQAIGARWTPSHDIRVDAKEGKTTMVMDHLASVSQNTGEDWACDELVLSTAKPDNSGGTLPSLPPLEVSLYNPPPPPFAYTASAQTCLFGAASSTAGGGGGLFGAAPGAGQAAPPPPPPLPVMEQKEVEMSSSLLSTQFHITRRCEFPSDGTNHKVTIGRSHLAPHLVHESVPSRNPTAFLTARCTNTSSIPILEGQASVFLDGAFVSKIHLKAAFPGEKFSCSLGPDSAVKLDYKPLHKHQQQVGIINKNTSILQEQVITVKNTRDDTIWLTVKERIPRSTDAKVVVKLLSPEKVVETEDESHEGEDAEKPTKKITISSSKIIAWTIQLHKGETENLVLKYAVEHPPNERLTYSDRLDMNKKPQIFGSFR